LKEIYEEVLSGWLYQTNETGEIKYDYDYVHNVYDRYAMVDEMSKLRYDFIKRNVKFKSILDVGYGNGSFLKYCSKHGKICFGYDISGYELPKEISVINSINEAVDVVTFFDSLEHFPQRDLNSVLDQLKCRYISISVPWNHYSGKDFKDWKHRKPNEHRHHFNATGLASLFYKSNFSLIEVSSYEDKIRGTIHGLPNILSAIFKKSE